LSPQATKPTTNTKLLRTAAGSEESTRVSPEELRSDIVLP
jgi:hypothetical protein